MRPARAIFFYFAIVFIGGALLAPWLYFLVQWLASGAFPQLSPLAASPFHRYVNRSLLLLAVCGLWPLLRQLGLDNWQGIGLRKNPNWASPFGRGLLLGFLSLAMIAAIIVLAGIRQLNLAHSTMEWIGHLTKAGSAALVVAVLEELLFRGALFGELRKALRWQTALLASSAAYALLHFFQRPESPQIVGWTSGLVLLPRMMRGFTEPALLVPGFFNLTVAGILLGLAYQKSAQLYFSMGLHAGWIFWLKSYGFLTTELAGKPNPFWGSGKLIDGWLAFIVLLLLTPFLWKLVGRQASEHSN